MTTANDAPALPPEALPWLQRQLAANRFLPVPPPELHFVGDGDFRAIGAEFLGHFVGAGLKPDDRVLDIGCGVGRMAVPLTQYLSPRGSYDGVDVVRPGIEWCRGAIGAAYGNFRFHHLDLRHPIYNAAGAETAGPVRLPFADGGFDFALMTSVVTHLRSEETATYAGELGRLLRPGGRCLVSLFLFNARAREHIRRTRPRLAFDPDATGHEFHAFADAPMAAVAYDEDFIIATFERNGLHRALPTRYGSWCGRAADSYQDICVFEKQ